MKSHKMTMNALDLLKTTPSLQQWVSEHRQIGVTEDTEDLAWDYLYANLRVDKFLLVLDVVWPNFIRKEQYILRESAIPTDWDNFKEEALRANWNSSGIEYVVNHLRVADLFINDPDVDLVTGETLAAIADVIVELWRHRLQSLFPEESFLVDIEDRDIDPEVYAYRSS